MVFTSDGWQGLLYERSATHILSSDGDSHVEWCEGNIRDYGADKMRRLGTDGIITG